MIKPFSDYGRLVDCLGRLKNDSDFKEFVKYLEENRGYMAEQAVKTQAHVSDEYSGAWKFVDALLNLVNLEEYKERPEVDRRFI